MVNLVVIRGLIFSFTHIFNRQGNILEIVKELLFLFLDPFVEGLTLSIEMLWKEINYVNELDRQVLQINIIPILQNVFEQEFLTLTMISLSRLHIHYKTLVSYKLLVTKHVYH